MIHRYVGENTWVKWDTDMHVRWIRVASTLDLENGLDSGTLSQ
jgi:hypothetical protein